MVDAHYTNEAERVEQGLRQQLASLKAEVEKLKGERDALKWRLSAAYCVKAECNDIANEERRLRIETFARAEALQAKLDKAKSTLNWIAHAFTEDSHGGMKTLPATEYQNAARATLSELSEASE